MQETPTYDDWSLTVLHTNDSHSHLDADYKGRYGAAKVKYTVDKVKAAYDNRSLPECR